MTTYQAGMMAAHAVLRRSFTVIKNPKQMVLSWTEAAVRHYIATEGDLGLANAFITGDISFVDKNEGVLNFFMVCLANFYSYRPVSEGDKWSHGPDGGWRPIISTAAIASAKYFYQHVARRNTITQARQNVARHYDLAKVEEQHELLEIGCGWGSFAIEVVKKRGCRYNGITLAEEQLKYAEQRVRETGLQSPPILISVSEPCGV
ncbi:hypothetical protein Cgig2_022134 [Carnegiea gigantea]|uniref:Cyclopropane-fatty-acyl-phospholipid synthase n=1 Tax=Carnegiea gigantea TaxID=171969 RepID=A0A9Q1K137_9CARY|nr:hypothetical protein Cgig2_022134 [Carnegiea gigantea]